MLSGRYLSDILPLLSVERVLDVAQRIELARARAPGRLEQLLGDWLQVDRPALFTTPFQLRAGLIAREAGIVAFDPLERTFLPPAADWVHGELGLAGYRAKRRAERVDTPAHWPLAYDCPIAALAPLGATRASVGFMPTLIGSGWWPGVSEWELMHMARLTQALDAFHRVYLVELGRLDDAALELDRELPRAVESARLEVLAHAAREPGTRHRLLASEAATQLVDKALQVLGYELYAFRAGMFGGTLVEPDGPYLALGGSAEYAKTHVRRLNSAAFDRFREHCLTPGRDYATDAAGFEERCAAVLKQLLDDSAPSPAPVVSAARARRVLADVGQRLCHLAARRQHNGLFQEALDAIAEAIYAVDSDGPAVGHVASRHDALVVDALQRVLGAVDGKAAFNLFTLGYCPVADAALEPSGVREIRAGGLVRRAWALHPAVGAALDGCRSLASHVVAGPGGRPLLEALGAASTAIVEELPALTDGYFGWLRTAFSESDTSDAEVAGRRWHYRLACRTLPSDPAQYAAYEVTWNPYLRRVPLAFDAVWNDELMRATPGLARPFKPKQARAAWYCYVGPGRDDAVYLPLVPRLSALVHALRTPMRLHALVAHPDFGPAFMRQAIESQAVLVFHKPVHARPARPVDFFDEVGAGTDAVQVELAGPWDDPEQAAAYEAFCARSAHYHASSRALCELAAIPPDARVGELGFGTGVTTLAILERLGAKGRLVAVDPAPLMCARASATIADERVRFEVGSARALAWSAVYDGGFDRVIGNASIWLSPDIARALSLLRRATAPGGRLALSLPADFLGRFDHARLPAALAVSSAIARARAELGLSTPEPAALDPALGSTDAFARALESAGWGDARFELYEREWTVGEYLEWTSMPVVAERLCIEAERERVGELLAVVSAGLDPAVKLTASWYLVTAESHEESA